MTPTSNQTWLDLRPQWPPMIDRAGREVPGNALPVRDGGIWLRRHKHEWFRVGNKTWPVGTTHPVYECRICTDRVECMDFHSGDDPQASLQAMRDFEERDRNDR